MKHAISLSAALTLTSTVHAAPHRRADGSRNIYVAGYDGLVRTLHYDGTSGLTLASETDGCKANPTWLTIQPAQDRLWCLDEGWEAGYGTLNRFSIGAAGTLSHELRHNLSAGPVQTEFYNDGNYLAVAQYGGPDDGTVHGGITLHEILADGAIGTSYNHTFDALPTPGPRPAQGVPRGHGVTLDPTGGFIVVPDLGADKVRTFAVDAATGDVSENAEVQRPIGTGPRHAEFAQLASGETYLFLVSEFANTITTFSVAYPSSSSSSGAGGMAIEPIHEIDTFGGAASPELIARSSAAEIVVSPDRRFVIVSNRNDGSFADSGGAAADSLATYAIQPDGSLTFVQLASAGGTRPRQFALNEDGGMVLVAAQGSERVVVLQRDARSGEIGGELAALKIETGGMGTPAAIWG